MFDFDPNHFQLEDLDRVAAQGEAALRALTDAMAEIDTVAGEGEAADGLIRVTLDGTGRVTEVVLNPRAMRLGSTAIAEGLRDACNAAQTDLHDKTRELVSGVLPGGVTEDDVTPEKTRGRFDEILASFDQAMGERQAAFDRLRRDAEGPA